jgi:hypothetical protein
MLDIIFDGSQIRPSLTEFNAYLSALDSYDQPYFILVKSSLLDETVTKAITDSSATNYEQNYCEHFTLADGVSVFCGEYDPDLVQSFVKEIMTMVSSDASPAGISVFCHNCLGEPSDTIKHLVEQFETANTDASGKSFIAFNDFTGDDWPGMQSYLSLAVV